MGARLCTSAELECVKPVHRLFLLKAEVKFSENRTSCLEYLRGCLRYGESVVMTCAAFAPYSSFPLSRGSQNLVDRATRLGTKRTEISVETVARTRGAFLQLDLMAIFADDASLQEHGSSVPSIRSAYRRCIGWIVSSITYSTASLPGLPSWMHIRRSPYLT